MPVPLAAALRFVSWLCIPTIAILSLVPGEARPHTGFPGQIEHVLAYFLTALLLGVHQRTLASVAILALALCAYAGILETLQVWVPGRNAQLIDFAASSCGALSGVSLSTVFLRFRQ